MVRVIGEVPGQTTSRGAARVASPGEARSLTAVFMAAGADPRQGEVQGAVEVLIELTSRPGREAPRTYDAIGLDALEALAEFRRRRDSQVIDATA